MPKRIESDAARAARRRKLALEAAAVLLTPGGKAKLIAGGYFLLRRGADTYAPLILEAAKTAAQRVGVTEVASLSGTERRLARAVAAIIPAVNASHLEALSQAAKWKAAEFKARRTRRPTQGN